MLAVRAERLSGAESGGLSRRVRAPLFDFALMAAAQLNGAQRPGEADGAPVAALDAHVTDVVLRDGVAAAFAALDADGRGLSAIHGPSIRQQASFHCDFCRK
jgi:hypothetical protein